MTPVYQTADITLYKGDCLQVLPTLEAGSVDCVVTDPPYGIGFRKGASGRAPYGKNGLRPAADIPKSRAIIGDDRPFDPTPFLAWPCVLFGADHFHERLPSKGAFHAWDKRAHCTHDDDFSDVEFFWSSRQGRSHLWKGILRASEGGRKFHISQKPVHVMARILEWFTEPGQTILDPYCGSGATLIACLKTGRKAIGIEIDENYVRLATRRLREAETPLFPTEMPA